MINTLASLDKPEVSAVLAQAAQLLLSTPRIEDVRELSEQGLPGRVVLELRERVLHKSRSSDQLIANLTEELSREMSEWTLAGVNLTEVRARAGERGSLTVGLYEILFSPHFERNSPLFSIKQSYVVRAIINASATEHLSPQVVKSAMAISLFIQTPRVKGSPYSLLIKCNRIGPLLAVEDALYLFHDTFDLREAVTPKMALIAFVERFGVPILLGDDIRGNPLHNVVAKFPEDGSLTIGNVLGANQVKFSGEPGSQFEVIMAYAIDQHKYAGYLMAHGIKSRAVGEVTTTTMARNDAV